VPPNPFRLVLDTNILVRAFINLGSDSGRILQACEKRMFVPLLSQPVLREYRLILGDPVLCSRYPQLDRPEVAVSLERLTYVGDVYRRARERFNFPRDPNDSHLIELAIVGRATHLISTDDDLLSLTSGSDDAARRLRQRLPNLKVTTPHDFFNRHRDELDLD